MLDSIVCMNKKYYPKILLKEMVHKDHKIHNKTHP